MKKRSYLAFLLSFALMLGSVVPAFGEPVVDEESASVQATPEVVESELNTLDQISPEAIESDLNTLKPSDPRVENHTPGKDYVEDVLMVSFTQENPDKAIYEELIRELGYTFIKWTSFTTRYPRTGYLALVGIDNGDTLQEAEKKLLESPLVDIVELDAIYRFTGEEEKDEYNKDIEWDRLKPGVNWVENEALVIFYDYSKHKENYENIIKDLGYELLNWTSYKEGEAGKIAHIRVTNGDSMYEAEKKLEEKGLVRLVEPDAIFRFTSASVSDPETINQWYLDAVNIPAAWDMATCDNEVTVAVIDSGMDLNHPDLADNILTNYAWDVVNQAPISGDPYHHGTPVAGVISAVADNELGIAGVSYNANILPVGIYSGRYVDTDAVVDAFDYILDLNDPTIKVINFSLTTDEDSFALHNRVTLAYLADILTVCSSEGELAQYPVFPSIHNLALSVVATNQNNEQLFSSVNNGAYVVSAPGQNIYSTIPGEEYIATSGTSFSTAIVSGIAALIFKANPNLSATQVADIICRTATDLGAPGVDEEFGYGLVNAEKAVLYAVNNTWSRLSGDTRYQTNQCAVEAGWRGESCDTIVVATGENFPDALTGGSLAGIYDCPVVLTCSDNQGYDAWSVASRLNARNVIIIGGTASLSEQVETTLAARVGRSHVTRITGATRYDTALQIYQQGIGNWSDTAIICKGSDSADAMAISAYAYTSKSPIFLADNGSLDTQTMNLVTSGAFNKVIIVGGETAVTTQTENQLKSRLGNQNVLRLYGQTRYETSEAVVNWSTGDMTNAVFQPIVTLSKNTMVLANGDTARFADALSGASLAGHKAGTLLLMDNALANNDSLQHVVYPNIPNIDQGYLIGGTASFGEDIYHDLVRRSHDAGH